MTGILNLLASGKPPTAAVTPYQIERSLRFNSSDSAYLSWTPPVAGNRKTWTWSGWIKRSVLSSSEKAIFIVGSTLTEGGYFNIAFSNDKLVCGTGAAELRRTTAVYRDTSAWYHVVVAIDTTKSTAADRVKIYVNGLEVTTFDTNAAPTQNVDTAVNSIVSHNCGRNSYNSTNFFDGYIADVYFIDGQQLTPAAFGATSATTGVWTPSAYTGTYGTNGFRLPFSDNSSALNLGCNTAQTGDELWPYTTLHLSGNPANTSGYNCFSDKSGQNSGNGFPITVNGDTRSSSFSPYNTNWSNYFLSSSSQYLSIANNTALQLSGDFTIELWVYLTATTGQNQVLLSKWSTSQGYLIYYDNVTQKITFQNTAVSLASSGTFSLNAWKHVAVTRSGNNYTLYVDGSVAGTSTNSTTITDAGVAVNIGRNIDGPGNYTTGYISNLRIVKGVVVYTGAFIPPTTALTATQSAGTNIAAITAGQTTLLTCQSNRFIDNGQGNTGNTPFTITISGSPTVNNFGPFLETDTTSGSGYFNGTGDYVTVPNNAAFDFGNADFTIEGWFYATSSSYTGAGLISKWNDLGNQRGWILMNRGTDGTVLFNYSTTGSDYPGITFSNAALTVNAWTHLALVRSGNTLTLYRNGLSMGSSNFTATIYAPSAVQAIGCWFGGSGTPEATSGFSLYPGYMSNIRVVKGIAVYSGTSTTSSNFTLPTNLLDTSGAASTSAYASTTNINTTFASTATSLLTLQDRINYNNSGFQDSSGNNFVITRPSGANVTQGSFSPFSNSGWSNYFSGSQNLTFSPANTLKFGTNNFTVEAWVYRTGGIDATYGAYIIDARDASNTGAWLFQYDSSSILWYDGISGTFLTSSSIIPLGAWTHIAYSRSGSTGSLFVNGTRTATWTDSKNYTVSGTTSYIGSRFTANGYHTGNLSNVRIVNGTAVYDPTQTTITVPTAPLTAISGTSLLTCHGNRFFDASPNNFTITTNGSPTVQAFSPFTSQSTTPTSYSIKFNGTTDYLTTLANTAFDIGGSEFTIECWAYTASTTNAALVNLTNLSQFPGLIVLASATSMRLVGAAANSAWNVDVNITGLASVANQWTHFAVTRSGNVWSLWRNGSLAGSGTYAVTIESGLRAYIGADQDNVSVNDYWNGHISNVRIIKNQALFSGTFTPSTSPLTTTTVGHTGTGAASTITGTISLLACQSNRFVDSSSNNFTITANGSAAPREFNPFGNTITTMAYSSAVHGGSAYFDGSGDTLTLTTTSALSFGTGDWTIEFWVYRTDTDECIIYEGRSTEPQVVPHIQVNPSGYAMFYVNGAARITGTTLIVNGWYHIAVVKNGGSTKLFVNGAQEGGTYSDSNNYTIGGTLYIGGDRYASSSAYTKGYVSSLRVVKGTAFYTAAFTPPSGPLTAIPGTSLLLNFNNAGIVDYTGKNVLETLGNASNVTSLKKSLISAKGSLYFDGTGDTLSIPSSLITALGTSDFTLEAWIYLSSNPTNCMVYSNGNWAANKWALQTNGGSAVNKVTFWVNNINANAATLTSSTTLTTSTWYHVAVTRSGSTFKLFINGTQEALTTSSASLDGSVTTTNYVGSDGVTASTYFNGNIQDLRITKYARYTGTFTPPVRTFAHNVLDIGHKQWVPNNFSVTSGTGNDSLVDTPTLYGIDTPVAGSYATFDAASSSVTLSNGNLTLTGVGGSGYNKANTTTAVSSGKWYFEATLVSAATDTSIGISQGNSSSTYPGQEATSYAYVLEKGQKFNGNSPAAYAASLAAGDVFMCAFDLDNNKLFFGKNGTWFASSNPATGANPAFTLTAGTYRAVGRPYGTNTATFNFGASTFAYTPPAGFAGLQDFVSGGVVRGNYATLNPLDTTATLSNGNLDVTRSATAAHLGTRGTVGVTSGKWYWEATYSAGGTVGSSAIGVAIRTWTEQDYCGTTGSWSYHSNGNKYLDGSAGVAYGAAYTNGDIIGIAFDADAGTISFYKNGVSQGQLATGLTSGPYFPAASVYNASGWNFNFGQRPFAYAAPSGFKALCTQNLPAPAVVKSNTAFDALIWSGDGVNNRKLTTNFSPDLFWAKARNTVAYHSINDSVRGANAILQTNTTSAEQVNSNGYVTTFAADGVNVTNGSDINASGTNYVGWAWDAGTTTVVNTAGSISANVRVNASAGISIATFATLAGGSGTFGHGLGVAPKFIIQKSRTGAQDWYVYHSSLGASAYMLLNSSAASVSSTAVWGGTTPSSAIVTLGSGWTNTNHGNVVAYCFAEIPGFSSFGQWTGNGSADGPFIYTDFKPAVVIAKQTNTSGQNWYILNNESSTYNVVNRRLYPNLSLDESADGNINCDFVSNGFKLRDAYTGWNASGGTYIYAAFAENPFKYSLAR